MKLLIAIISMLLGVVLACVFLGARFKPHVCPVAFKDYTPSPTEAQKYLGVTPDGIIGPETYEAWLKRWLDETGYELIVEFGGGDDNDEY